MKILVCSLLMFAFAQVSSAAQRNGGDAVVNESPEVTSACSQLGGKEKAYISDRGESNYCSVEITHLHQLLQQAGKRVAENPKATCAYYGGDVVRSGGALHSIYYLTYSCRMDAIRMASIFR